MPVEQMRQVAVAHARPFVLHDQAAIARMFTTPVEDELVLREP